MSSSSNLEVRSQHLSCSFQNGKPHFRSHCGLATSKGWQNRRSRPPRPPPSRRSTAPTCPIPCRRLSCPTQKTRAVSVPSKCVFYFLIDNKPLFNWWNVMERKLILRSCGLKFLLFLLMNKILYEFGKKEEEEQPYPLPVMELKRRKRKIIN